MNLFPQTINPSTMVKYAKKYFFERIITVSEEDVLLHTKLNTKQLKAYNVITARIFSKKPEAFLSMGQEEQERHYYISRSTGNNKI